jgi:hypothetical protein
MMLDRQDIEVLAVRVVELLRESDPQRNDDEPTDLIDAAAVARRLGISRATVYAKADQLGAIRLGNGKRARLRFDPARLPAPMPAQSNPSPQPRVRRLPRSARSSVELLPIRGGSARAH